MVNLICTPVDIENECTVMWNVSVIYTVLRIYCTYICVCISYTPVQVQYLSCVHMRGSQGSE